MGIYSTQEYVDTVVEVEKKVSGEFDDIIVEFLIGRNGKQTRESWSVVVISGR